MMTTKLIDDGGSQVVRLPEGCRFGGDEGYASRVGDAAVSTPKGGDVLASMLAAAGLFTDDFMEGVRDLSMRERG